MALNAAQPNRFINKIRDSCIYPKTKWLIYFSQNWFHPQSRTDKKCLTVYQYWTKPFQALLRFFFFFFLFTTFRQKIKKMMVTNWDLQASMISLASQIGSERWHRLLSHLQAGSGRGLVSLLSCVQSHAKVLDNAYLLIFLLQISTTCLFYELCHMYTLYIFICKYVTHPAKGVGSRRTIFLDSGW